MLPRANLPPGFPQLHSMESAGQLREDAGVSCPCRRRPVEALKLKTLDDLFLSQDERVGPVGGEIVRRPMVWFITHGRAQTRTALALRTLGEGEGSGGGWWFATDTEVSVAYETHECPSHDLAGWRREQLPRLPDGGHRPAAGNLQATLGAGYYAPYLPIEHERASHDRLEGPHRG